jgi:hypothetical protein
LERLSRRSTLEFVVHVRLAELTLTPRLTVQRRPVLTSVFRRVRTECVIRAKPANSSHARMIHEGVLPPIFDSLTLAFADGAERLSLAEADLRLRRLRVYRTECPPPTACAYRPPPAESIDLHGYELTASEWQPSVRSYRSSLYRSSHAQLNMECCPKDSLRARLPTAAAQT